MGRDEYNFSEAGNRAVMPPDAHAAAATSQDSIMLRLARLEADAALQCRAQMDELRAEFPLWFGHMEDLDPDVASAEDLAMLLETAPNAFAKGMIFGKLMLRMQIAAMTRRGF